MPREAIAASHALASFLRRKRLSLSMTLQDVSERTKQLGDKIPPSSLHRIESGRAEPGYRRVHQLLGIYKVSPEYASDLVELENLGIGEPVEGDLESLCRQGI